MAFLIGSCKPEFFKVLFPDPFANLRIPRKFHMNLPHDLPKAATLFSPNGKFWNVEIRRNGEDIYFEKGWSEFAKAHDLRVNYFVVFRYEVNMIFKVKVFDTACCLKNYPLTSHKRRYVEIEEVSESGDHTLSQSSQGKKAAGTGKGKGKAQVAEAEEENEDEEEDEVPIKKAAPPKEKRTNKNPVNGKAPKVVKRENEEMSVDSTICYSQFEMILKPYAFSYECLLIPKQFCVKNGLLTKRTIFLKRGGSSEGKSWPVCFYFGDCRGYFGKGWKEFREGAGLKQGDRCIFRLVSKTSLVVDVMLQESNATGKKEGTVNEGSTSSAVALEKKKTQQRKAYSMPILECERIVRKYYLYHSYQSLSKKFCLENKLTSTRDVTLKDVTGNEWRAKFYLCAKEGRLSQGWADFSSDCGLKAGDKCIFKLVAKDTLLVRVVKN